MHGNRGGNHLREAISLTGAQRNDFGYRIHSTITCFIYFRGIATMPDLLDAAFLEPVDHLEDFLRLHLAVRAQIDIALVLAGHELADPLGEHIGRHGFVVLTALAHVDAMILSVAEGHGDIQALAGHLLRLSRHRQVDLDAALQHRRRHHEDDEQHEHHVHERDDVDLGEARRDAAPTAPAAPDFRHRHDFRHALLSSSLASHRRVYHHPLPSIPPLAYVKFRSAMLRNSRAKSSISDA